MCGPQAWRFSSRRLDYSRRRNMAINPDTKIAQAYGPLPEYWNRPQLLGEGGRQH